MLIERHSPAVRRTRAPLFAVISATALLIGLFPLAVLAADPVAVDDSYTMPVNASTTSLDVLANDTDADIDDTLTIIDVTVPANGTAAINGDEINYQPTAAFHGIDSFDYTIEDTTTGTSSATATVTVNSAPNAVNDNKTVLEDDPATVVAVLANDTDPDNDTLTITGKTNGAKGTVVITGGGTGLTYNPTTNLNGSDSFTYTISDGNGGFDTATVDVTIRPEPDDPIAVDDDLSVGADASATDAHVLDNDTDPDGDSLTVVSNSDPSKGVVVIAGDGSGLTYRPNSGAFGDDSFTYTISDGTGAFDSATVSVSIGLHAANDAGLNVPESAGATPLDVLANDFPQDGSLTIIAKTNGNHGTVAITGGGTGLTYNPDQLYKGNDVFTYTISDGLGGTDTATVVLTVVKDTIAPSTSAPDAAIRKQTAGTKTTKVRASWSGTDTGTGVASYKVQVQTDGGSWSTAVSSTSGSQYDRTLTNARTYRFRVRATDKEGNTGLYTYGSTFKVWRYQDTSSTVQLSGHWTTRRVKATLGKHHSFTSSTAASASLIMTMRDVAVVATKTSKSGHAEVWIDGSLAGTVDLHAKSTKYRKVVFRHHFTDLAGHTIKLLPVGDGRIHLDAFLTLR